VTSAEDTSDSGVGHGHDDDVMNMVESGVEISSLKPLSELTIGEVGRFLESIKFDEFKVVFAKDKIDGKCLFKRNIVGDVKEMGIPMTVKASLLLDEIRKWKAANRDTSEVTSNGKLVRPLSELSVHEVGIVLEALKLGKYKDALINNEIDGKCLMKCNTIEDVVNIGISIVVKASLLLDEIRKWKTTGVPTEYLSVNPSASQDDDRNAEVKSPIVSYVPLTITHIIVL
jgi:hypothetical protein